MRNSLFMGVLVAAILVLTAALAFTVIDHDAGASEQGNDISRGGEFTCGAGLTVNNTSDLIMVTNSSGSGSRVNMTVYRPKTLDQGWYWVGDLVEPSFKAPAGQVTVVYANDPTALAPPADWKLVWKDFGSGADLDTSFWVPVPPKGYVALGGVAVQGYNKPVLTDFRCVKKEYVVDGVESRMIWNDKGSHATSDVAIWSISPDDPNGLDASTFWPRSNYYEYPEDSVYCLNKAYLA